MRSRFQWLFTLVSVSFLSTACAFEMDDPEGLEALETKEQPLGSPYKIPREISTLQELNTVVRNDPYGWFKLTANIDMTPAANWNNGTGFSPIYYFQGTFDGNGYQIRNLKVTSGQILVGLFAQLDGAIVRNLGLTNVNVRGAGLTGGLAGTVTNSLVTNSYVEGTVTGASSRYGNAFEIGLFAGAIRASTVERSYSRGTVNGSIASAGGFAGTIAAEGGARSVVQECYARVSVLPTSTANNVTAGGFAAVLDSSTATNLYALGTVRGRNYVGGLIGIIAGEGNIFDFSYSRNTVEDWSIPGKAGTYGAELGTTAHFGPLLWDSTVDSGAAYAPGGQARYSTAVLQAPTATSQFPYDNGTDADWDPTIWNAGSSTQYNTLRNVARPTQQSTN